MIDLFSDTVTQPTPAMRRAMAEAATGDEQRGLDPTTNALQERAAQLLGKEAALFLPSATMANLIACRLHTRPGEAVILEQGCHILNAEGGGLAVHSGLVPRPIAGDRGRFTPEQVREQLTPAGHYRPPTTLVTCEQTHNAAGGAVWPVEELVAVCQAAREAGLKTHLDGARLFNAAVADCGLRIGDCGLGTKTGSPDESGLSLPANPQSAIRNPQSEQSAIRNPQSAAAVMAAPFDTVMICLSKGLGAPAGAILAGPVEAMCRARTLKQLFGGSMRQSGILAAAGLYALDQHVERLAEDHANARRLAHGLSTLESLDVEPVETNIVCVGIRRTGLTAPELIARLAADGLSVSSNAPYRLRFVTHLDITAAAIDRAVEISSRAISD